MNTQPSTDETAAVDYLTAKPMGSPDLRLSEIDRLTPEPMFVCRSCGDGTSIRRTETVNAAWPLSGIARRSDGSLGYERGVIETEDYYKYDPEYVCDNCGELESSLADLVIEATEYCGEVGE